jgi:hypothetical protein
LDATAAASSRGHDEGHADGSDTGHIWARTERVLVDFAATLADCAEHEPGVQSPEPEHCDAATTACALCFTPRLAAWEGTTAKTPTAVASRATDRMRFIESPLSKNSRWPRDPRSSAWTIRVG